MLRLTSVHALLATESFLNGAINTFAQVLARLWVYEVANLDYNYYELNFFLMFQLTFLLQNLAQDNVAAMKQKAICKNTNFYSGSIMNCYCSNGPRTAEFEA